MSSPVVAGQILSHYRILEHIGSGGMGVVYRAHDEQLERDVAIKVLPPGTLTDEDARRRFRKEALALAKLNHPNIETVHEFGAENGIDFLVTEYIPGCSLDEKLINGSLDEKEIVTLGLQLTEGLEAAHDQGLVHRDLKPANLRISPNGRLKILDFGLARLVEPESDSAIAACLTQQPEIRGTLPYMSPERLRGKGNDPRSDIWATGAVLYEMATAQRPFSQTQSAELMAAILSEDPPPPHELNATISSGLESIILKALEKEPQQRYQSARELHEDLKSSGLRASTVYRSAVVTGKTISVTGKTISRQTPTLEIAHVLFTDIVAYSLMPMDQQQAVLHKLQEAVRNTESFVEAQATDRLIRLPTGDGMALVFFGDAEAPARCALELQESLKQSPEVKLRMGIHTGPVYRVADINANRNVAGGGINVAQRVMDCGDAGHILVSKSVADVLGHLSTWNVMLHDLGEAEVKHGVRVHVFNLYNESSGNAKLPHKLHTARQAAQTMLVAQKRRKIKKVTFVVLAVVLATGSAAGWFYWRRANTLTEKDTIVLSDFTNTTGDNVFDDALKQGLAVGLDQSPFLNILSDDRVRQQLRYMGKPPDERLTPAIARDVCQRSGSRAMLVGSISPLGSHYVIGIRAVNCQNGDSLGSSQAEADSREHVLSALNQAQTQMRKKLGESLASIQKYDISVEEATTPSLEALQAYSKGLKTWNLNGETAALPELKRAVELDPGFAMAYGVMGVMYFDLGETELAIQNSKKAYDLRTRVTEKEKFYILSHYYQFALGDLEKAEQLYEQWLEIYPRDVIPHMNLGAVALYLGQYDKALQGSLEGLRLDPDDATNYENLAGTYIGLNRFDEAAAVLADADKHGMGGEGFLQTSYLLAFMRDDEGEMKKMLTAAAGKPGTEDLLLATHSSTQAFHGRVEEAREFSKQAVASALRNGAKETAAIWQATEALQEAELGNADQARQQAMAALNLAPGEQVKIISALALARVGEGTRVATIVDELGSKYPEDTLVMNYWLPSIRAAMEISRNKPDEAANDLQATIPYELGGALPNVLCVMYPVYLRGEAALMAKQGDTAITEFEKIVDHRGIASNCPLAALAYRQLARAYSLQKDAARERVFYDKFLQLWQSADPELPLLRETKSALATLRTVQ